MRLAGFLLAFSIAVGATRATIAQGISLWVNGPRYGYSSQYIATYGYGAPLAVGYGYPQWVYEYYPRYPSPYGYGGIYGYTWPYYLDTGSGVFGPYVAPPLYVPPEQLGFGPQAVRQLMGLDRTQRPIVNHNILVAPAVPEAKPGDRGNAADNGANAAGFRIRDSNAEARERSRQFIDFGDQQFAALNLAGAYDRYKKASEAALDLAEPYFRLGHTLAAMGRFEQSADAFGRGLNLRPDWPTSGFRLVDIYRDKDAARFATLDMLKRAAAARPNDQHAQFVGGVQFYFDGQAETARLYFERAKSLGTPAAYVEPFLKPPQNGDQAGELDI
jgi:tetratricopeptide (TPR) repeat protein